MVCNGAGSIVNQEIKIFTWRTMEIEIPYGSSDEKEILLVLFGYRMSFSEVG